MVLLQMALLNSASGSSKVQMLNYHQAGNDRVRLQSRVTLQNSRRICWFIAELHDSLFIINVIVVTDCYRCYKHVTDATFRYKGKSKVYIGEWEKPIKEDILEMFADNRLFIIRPIMEAPEVLCAVQTQMFTHSRSQRTCSIRTVITIQIFSLTFGIFNLS